jgi:hypothetical protein
MTKPQFKLGDAIAKLTKVLHIPHCAKCEQRRLILNEIQKLGVKETMKQLKATGLKEAPKGKQWSLEDIMDNMTDCCGEK